MVSKKKETEKITEKKPVKKKTVKEVVKETVEKVTAKKTPKKSEDSSKKSTGVKKTTKQTEKRVKPKLTSMNRCYTTLTIQKKAAILVEEGTSQSSNDMQVLKENGYFVYGVRHSESGRLLIAEDSLVIVNHFGYLVMKEELKFPVRKQSSLEKSLDVNEKYYCLNNQHTRFDIVGYRNGNITPVIKTL